MITNWYVRTDGGTAAQCTGTVDAPYPGTGTGQSCAFASLGTAQLSASCGDFVNLKAGQTFDYATSITLGNTGCLLLPVTIRSTAYASLPNGRVGPSDSANMARLRTTAGQPLFVDVSGGSYWYLDGLELTDSSNVDVGPALLDLRNGGKTTLRRVYAHPKETNPTWTRAVTRAMWYEESAGLDVEDSYMDGFLGFRLGCNPCTGSDLQTSEILLSISGKNVTLNNNFLAAWYGILFTGGGTVALPDITTTLSGAPTLTSAIFGTVTGITPGQLLRVNLKGAGTQKDGVFTRTAGAVITSADVSGPFGTGIGFPANGYSFELTAVSGNIFTIAGGSNLSDGTYNWEVYETIQVDSVVGNTVNYHSYGINGLAQAPSTANTTISWVTGDGTNAADWTVTRNTLWKDPAFVEYLRSRGFSTYQGKGVWELKHVKRMLVDGNRIVGWPNSLFYRLYNSVGAEPWSTIQDITITNNLFESDQSVTETSGAPFSINLDDPYHSATPGKNVIIANNLITRGWEILENGQYGSSVQIRNNTIVNNVSGTSYHSAFTYDQPTTSGWVVRDNILSYRLYGAQCLYGNNALSTCWPSGTWNKNVVVDTQNTGVTTSTWGPGSILPPVPTAFPAVGFVDMASSNYRIATTSPYYHQGTGGVSPGVDQDALEAALRPAGTPTPTPTPIPTPTPTPVANFTISGTDTLNGSALAGVSMRLLRASDRSLLSSTISAVNGTYTLSAASGISVIVSPSLSGYTFNPGEVLYSTISNNQTQNFAAIVVVGPTPTPTPLPSPTPAPTPTPTPSPGTCGPNQLLSTGCTCLTKPVGPSNARRCRP